MKDISDLIGDLLDLSDAEVLAVFNKIVANTAFSFTGKERTQLVEIEVNSVDLNVIDASLADIISLSDQEIATICINVGVEKALPYPKIIPELAMLKDPVFVISGSTVFHTKNCKGDNPINKGKIKVDIERSDAEKNYKPCPLCIGKRSSTSNF